MRTKFSEFREITSKRFLSMFKLAKEFMCKLGRAGSKQTLLLNIIRNFVLDLCK